MKKPFFDPETDFPAYFTAKDISPECESCGRNEWKTIYFPIALPADGIGSRPMLIERRATVYALCCGHCGNVRFYLREVVNEWHANQT